MKMNITEDDDAAERKELLLRIEELENVNHMLAHNLRGAASNIKMLSDLLIDRQQENPRISYNELAKVNSNILGDDEIVECINQSSDAMISTLSNMMVAIDQRLHEQVADECDVEQIVHSIFSQLNGFMLQKQVNIVLNLAIKQVRCVKISLESLLYNLINNAIKYSRPDVPLEINISTRKEKGRTVLHVKDNGMGIDMSKYGDKLFRLNQTFHPGHDSTGLGLYMTKEQVEAAGGSISVKSEVNAGTEFIVVL